MTMAAALDSPASSQDGTGAIGVARVDIIRDMAQAEPVWRGFENSAALVTAFQRFDLLNAWQSHVGAAEGATPLVAVAYAADGAPLLLLPFAASHESGVTVARFMGGKHTTFNMGLWRRDFAAAATRRDIDAVWSAIGAAGIDLLALTQQPRIWQGIANPLTLYPVQTSPNGCPLLLFTTSGKPEDNISNGFRRRLRGKERKLQAQPNFRYYLARSDDEIRHLLDWFFVIKPQRMAAQGLPDVFDEPGVREFVYQACLARTPDGGRAIAIHALECDDEIIAIFAGLADGRRFSMTFNTYTLSDNAKHSPGLILLRDIIDGYAAQNYRTFDLGIGSDDYKRQFCKDDEAIFDSFIALSARGRVAALGLSSLNRAKRIVKQNPALMQMAQRLRAALHR